MFWLHFDMKGLQCRLTGLKVLLPMLAMEASATDASAFSFIWGNKCIRHRPC